MSGTHVAMFVAPSERNRFKERSYRAVLFGSGVWAPLGAHAGSAARMEEEEEEEEGGTPRLPPGAHSTGHRRLTKTFLLFLHELIYGRLESSFSLKHQIPAKVASASSARVK